MKSNSAFLPSTAKSNFEANVSVLLKVYENEQQKVNIKYDYSFFAKDAEQKGCKTKSIEKQIDEPLILRLIQHSALMRLTI